MSLGQRDAIKAISPAWLSTGVGEKFLFACGLAIDALDEHMNQGMRGHMPTLADPTCLAAIGTDRQIPQGPNEGAPGYAARLQVAFDDWAHAGASRAVLRQTLNAFAPNVPAGRTVSDKSVWNTYVAGANTNLPPYHQQPSATVTTGTWNWDGATLWWRLWLVLYAGTSVVGTISGVTTGAPSQITTSAPHGLSTGAQVLLTGINRPSVLNGLWTITVTGASTFTLNGSNSAGIVVLNTGPSPTVYLVPQSSIANPGPVWGAAGTAWGDTNRSWGLSVPATTIAGTRALLKQWKGQHAWYTWQILSFDPTLFDPTSSSSPPNPDGTWGSWAKTVAGVSVPARAANAVYCDGTQQPPFPMTSNLAGPFNQLPVSA